MAGSPLPHPTCPFSCKMVTVYVVAPTPHASPLVVVGSYSSFQSFCCLQKPCAIAVCTHVLWMWDRESADLHLKLAAVIQDDGHGKWHHARPSAAVTRLIDALCPSRQGMHGPNRSKTYMHACAGCVCCFKVCIWMFMFCLYM